MAVLFAKMIGAGRGLSLSAASVSLYDRVVAR